MYQIGISKSARLGASGTCRVIVLVALAILLQCSQQGAQVCEGATCVQPTYQCSANNSGEHLGSSAATLLRSDEQIFQIITTAGTEFSSENRFVFPEVTRDFLSFSGDAATMSGSVTRRNQLCVTDLNNIYSMACSDAGTSTGSFSLSGNIISTNFYGTTELYLAVPGHNQRLVLIPDGYRNGYHEKRADD